MCAFGILWLSCEAPAAPKGVSHDSPRAKTLTFEGPGLHHQNSTRRHPEREKKSEIFGGPASGGLAQGG